MSLPYYKSKLIAHSMESTTLGKKNITNQLKILNRYRNTKKLVENVEK